MDILRLSLAALTHALGIFRVPPSRSEFIERPGYQKLEYSERHDSQYQAVPGPTARGRGRLTPWKGAALHLSQPAEAYKCGPVLGADD
jgi:hypothetical protein